MTGVWRNPDNDFATDRVPKRLQIVWKQDYKIYKKQSQELNPSMIIKRLCKNVRFKSVCDELSRSGFSRSRSLAESKRHVEIEFSAILTTHYQVG